jgi:beta-barrel assembly-enhancing protease
MRRSHVFLGLVIAVLGGLYYYCNQQVNPVTGEKQHVTISPQQEIAMGLQAAPEMEQQFGGELADPAVQEEVSRVGQKVVAGSDASRSEYKYAFHVLRDPETVNAFALPGGQVFITAGLLKHLQDEAQLAGVLGHETGHVVGRHAAEHLAKQQFTTILIGAAGVAASDDRGDGQRAAAVAAMVGSLVNMRFSRKDESEADSFGVKYMSQAGYDPRAMVELMRILKEAGGASRRPEFLSTHPDPGNREQAIEAEIAQLYPSGVSAQMSRGDKEAFARVRQHLGG